MEKAAAPTCKTITEESSLQLHPDHNRMLQSENSSKN